MELNDLERRALLGDQQAQGECTQLGILLPCPFCGEKAEAKTQKSQYGISGTIITCGKCFARVYCLDERAQITESGIRNVPVRNHKFLALWKWNRRPAPPIGRCKDCDCYWPNAEQCGYSGETVKENDFCSKFKPKEAPDD